MKKILCPNTENHSDHEKILMTYDLNLRRFRIFCSVCRRWVQIDINKKGGATTSFIPKGEHFELEATASVVKGTV